jgi:hypothetical protein
MRTGYRGDQYLLGIGDEDRLPWWPVPSGHWRRGQVTVVATIIIIINGSTAHNQAKAYSS